LEADADRKEDDMGWIFPPGEPGDPMGEESGFAAAGRGGQQGVVRSFRIRQPDI
jgi:hypothetical protein